MTPNDEGLLTDVATAIGATLGRVAHTTNELIDTAKNAKNKVSGRPARQVKKAARAVKARARRTATAAKKASRRASTSARRARKVAAAKARHTTRKIPSAPR